MTVNNNIAQPGNSADNISQWHSGDKSVPANQLNSYINSGIVGFDETKRTTSPVFRLGTLMRGEQDLDWIYAKASADISANTQCVLTTSGTPPAFTAAAGAGSIKAISAYKSGQYGWFQKNAVVITG